MYGTLVYSDSAAAAGATNDDQSAAVDPDFTRRNSHYIFTMPLSLLSVSLIGASVKFGRWQAPTWNGRGEFDIYAANRSLNPPSNPLWDYYFPAVQAIPQNQEIQLQVSNNLSTGTEQETSVVNIGTQDWSQNLPTGLYDIMLHATVTLTPTVNAWNMNNAISFSTNPLGGVYALLGSVVVGGNAVAYRWVFPRTRLYYGVRMRPGGIVSNTYGNVPNLQLGQIFTQWGVQGFFHTFELPQLDIFGTAASSTTYDCFMYCRFLGMDLSLLQQAVSSSY